MEWLSRVTQINGAEVESCLLSRSIFSSLIKLLPIAEYDLWVREMTVAGLDFRNSVGLETFGCFKRVSIIERNTNESSRANLNTKDAQSFNTKKTGRSNYKVQGQNEEESDEETSVLAV